MVDSSNRHRLRYTFWLDVTKQDEDALADIIENLKAERQFKSTVILGIELVAELRRGQVGTLIKAFPLVQGVLGGEVVMQTVQTDSRAVDDSEWQRIEEAKAEIAKQRAELEAERKVLDQQRKQLQRDGEMLQMLMDNMTRLVTQTNKALDMAQATAESAKVVQLPDEPRQMGFGINHGDKTASTDNSKVIGMLEGIQSRLDAMQTNTGVGNLEETQAMKPVAGNARQIGGGGLKQIGGGVSFAPPSFDDDDDDIELVVRKDETAGKKANQNFLNSLQGLMSYADAKQGGEDGTRGGRGS